MLKIDKKITAVSVVSEKPEVAQPQEIKHVIAKREDVLQGKTYKLKTPLSEHALYITINDVIENGQHKPFEIFINSKAMDNFQWIVAMTRIMSAVFRQGHDCSFLVEELHSVFDPKAGYFSKGKWIPSLVSEIGDIIEQHFISIGLIKKPELDKAQQKLVDEAYAKMQAVNHEVALDDGYPAGAVLCPKCQHRALVINSGCSICLHCSASSCS